jgi:hypothetical protein
VAVIRRTTRILDRLTAPSDSTGGGLSANHGHKPELGDVTITRGLGLIRPITEGRVLLIARSVGHAPLA